MGTAIMYDDEGNIHGPLVANYIDLIVYLGQPASSELTALIVRVVDVETGDEISTDTLADYRRKELESRSAIELLAMTETEREEQISRYKEFKK